MNCRRPKSLEKGDEVAVVAVSKRVDFEEIRQAIDQFEEWGLRVKLAENLNSTNHKTLAGSDKERLEGLQSMIDNPSIKAIFCARGGYGATRIIDQIDWKPLVEYPKWIVGFSDITALLNQAVQKNVEAIHALMPFQFKHEKYISSVESLRRLLFSEEYSIKIPAHPLNNLGQVRSSIIGGNLTMLTNLLGTSTDFDAKGKILLIEDIEEYLYKIDRMMVHLKRAGKLDGIAGLIVGHMTDMMDNEIPFGKTVEEIILEHVEEMNIPICFGFPSGHEPENLAVPFGREVDFEVKQEGVLLKFQ